MAALIPMVRRIVAARVADSATADDLVQETLVRVLAAAPRVEPGMLEPYAIVTARNVVASLWRERDRHRRNQHRVVDLLPEETPDDGPGGPGGAVRGRRRRSPGCPNGSATPCSPTRSPVRTPVPSPVSSAPPPARWPRS